MPRYALVIISLLKRILAKVKREVFGPKRYAYLFDVIRKNYCRRIMEIGTWNGRRAEKMILTAAGFRPASEVEYYGFDLFELMTPEIHKQELSKKPPTLQEVKSRLEQTGAKIYLFRGFTQETLPAAAGKLPKMDLIFIDGGHSIETITNDWTYARQLMDKKTVVIFDDYYFDRDDVGAKKVVESIDRSEYEVSILPRRDRFLKPWGILSINFVQVQKKK